jgi:hypothetical protein
MVHCRGINGSVHLFKGKMLVGEGGLSGTREIPYHEVSAVVVQRKSVVPFAALTILATIVWLLTEYNALGFIVNLTGIDVLVAPISLAVAILCLILTFLRIFFVNLLIRYAAGSLSLRLVPFRAAKRLAQRFSEVSAGE